MVILRICFSTSKLKQYQFLLYLCPDLPFVFLQWKTGLLRFETDQNAEVLQRSKQMYARDRAENKKVQGISPWHAKLQMKGYDAQESPPQRSIPLQQGKWAKSDINCLPSSPRGHPRIPQGTLAVRSETTNGALDRLGKHDQVVGYHHHWML